MHNKQILILNQATLWQIRIWYWYSIGALITQLTIRDVLGNITIDLRGTIGDITLTTLNIMFIIIVRCYGDKVNTKVIYLI